MNPKVTIFSFMAENLAHKRIFRKFELSKNEFIMKKFIFVLFSCVSLIISCNKEDGIQKSGLTILCVTSNASDITSNSALLSGAATVKGDAQNAGSAYFYYSSTAKTAEELKESGVRVSAGKLQKDGGEFSYTISNLNEETEYFYIASVIIEQQEETGSVRTFKTKNKSEGGTITISETSISLTTGEEKKLSVTISPRELEESSVAWESSDSNVATVDNGVVKAIGKGQATITASILNKTIKATCLVSVDIPISAETGTAKNITYCSATLPGKANLPDKHYDNLKIGILYSTEPEVISSSASFVEAKDLEKDNSFSITVNNLASKTAYYYRSYIYYGSEMVYGEIKDFTTAKINATVSTKDASGITTSSSTLNGHIDTEAEKSQIANVGFYFSDQLSSVDELIERGFKRESTIDEKGDFSTPIPELGMGTKYYYVAFAKVYDKVIYGEVKNFTTLYNRSYQLSINGGGDTKASIDDDFNIKWSTGDKVLLTDGTKSVLLTIPQEYNNCQRAIVETDCRFEGKVTCVYPGEAVNISNSQIIVKAANRQSGNIKDAILLCGQAVENETNISLKTKGAILQFNIEGSNISSVCVQASANEYLSGDFNIDINDPNLELKPGLNLYDHVVSVADYTLSIQTLNFLCLPGQISKMKLYIINKEGGCVMKEAKNTISLVSGMISRMRLVNSSEPIQPVDLGLSVKWLPFNLGTTVPEEPGDYYAWGEISTKNTYDKDGYKFGRQGSYTKYCTNSEYGKVDNITKLESQDDAASVKSSGIWRMPTKEEANELLDPDKCSWEMTELNGIKGYKVTSKVPGHTGQSIFLPNTGIYGGSSVKYPERGEYWTSSLSVEEPDCAHQFYIFNPKLESPDRDKGMYLEFRYLGIPIRPVAAK